MKKPTVMGGIAIAAVLWFLMFSPWTSGRLGFWPSMTASGLILAGYAFVAGQWKHSVRFSFNEAAMGILLAALLWIVFFVGDKISQCLFPFAKGQVEAIYTLKDGTNPSLVALLLLMVIGPAEEIFWRGFVQRGLMEKMGQWWGWIATTLTYTLVHIGSLNFMLLMAALVCGAFWGYVYMKWPKRLGAVIVSHALWDAAAFVVFPF
ncbi:MAG: type II CAAX endopeptidase family protein [Bacteroidales bacterium]|nr:type II CAAX endopeptidase family protein [Bacteroidales bacterium]